MEDEMPWVKETPQIGLCLAFAIHSSCGNTSKVGHTEWGVSFLFWSPPSGRTNSVWSGFGASSLAYRLYKGTITACFWSY